MSVLPVQATELEWLRWFYVNVRPALGPADGEILRDLAVSFQQETGKGVPAEYVYAEEDYQ